MADDQRSMAFPNLDPSAAQKSKNSDLPKPPTLPGAGRKESSAATSMGGAKAQSILTGNNGAVTAVQPSPNKIDAILEKDRRIKRRFFLQSLLTSSKQKGGAPVNPYGSA